MLATIAGLEAFVARPSEGEGPRPALVVLHESFGLNDDIRRIARRFADNGYVAVAPNLYSRGNKAFCLSRVLTDLVRGARGRTLDDLIAVRAAVAQMDDVDAGRVAVAGFCMGGSFALMLGTTEGVAAAAVNYGAVPKAREELDGVCPVVASYGGFDRLFASQGRRLEQHLAELGVPHDVKVYDGVGHSFINKSVPKWLARVPSPMHAAYSEEEAEDAWRRMLAFLAEHV